MKKQASTTTEENNWVCQTCGEEADPLYFVEGKKLCEQCKKDALPNKKRQQDEGTKE